MKLDVIRDSEVNLISNITFDKVDIMFKIELRGFVTVFEGDSSTGKSFFVNSLKELYQSYEKTVLKETNKSNLIFLDGCHETELIVPRLKALNNCLIILDFADILFTKEPKLSEYISQDQLNQYIIMSRGSYVIPVSLNHFCYLQRNGNIIYNKFEFNVPAWM